MKNAMLLSAFLSVVFLSCREKKTFCENQPESVPFRFRLVDHTGKDLLNPADSDYLGNVLILAPCFSMYDNTSSVRYAPDSFFCMAVRTHYLGSTVDVICRELALKYDYSAVVDTITYDTIKQEQNGCTVYSMSNVRFNGMLSTKTSVYGDSVFLFVK